MKTHPRTIHWRPPLLIALGVLLTGLAGWYVAFRGVSFKEPIALLVAAFGLAAVLAGGRGIRVGFVCWVLTFAIGYRTIQLSYALLIHPSEVLLWVLALLALVQYIIFRRGSMKFWLPGWLWLLMPFWAWGWLTGWQAGNLWDSMLAELRDFMLFIPLFIVAEAVLAERRYWRALLVAFFCTSASIAGMGVLEYYFPGVRGLLPGFLSSQGAIVSADGFLRASFSFWGTPAATFICALALPLAIVLWEWYPARRLRLLLLGMLGLQLLAIYIGGYRSIWYIAAVELALFFILRYGLLPGALALLPLLAGVQFLPQITQQRALSTLLFFQGQSTESSLVKRYDRASNALELALRQPWGVGWAGSGWPHNDFLQVAANLGLLAGLVFFGGYLAALVRLGRRVWRMPHQGEAFALGFALLLAFIAAGGLLAMEGVQVLPQLALPVWLVWVLVEVWLRQAPAEDSAA